MLRELQTNAFPVVEVILILKSLLEGFSSLGLIFYSFRGEEGILNDNMYFL
jgi:hypothetical protein